MSGVDDPEDPGMDSSSVPAGGPEFDIILERKGFELKLNEVTGLTVGGIRCFKQSIYVLEFSVHGILFRALLVAATILWLILVIYFFPHSILLTK